MAETKKAIIIGAGIGGITTSAYLAKSGYIVSVYEKNSTPGGRCSQIKRDGHRFDLGATMILMPGIYHEIFDYMGIRLEVGRDIIPLRNLYKIWFDDGTSLEFTSDKERMKQQLENIESGSFRKSQEYISKGYDIFSSSMKRLINRNFYNIFQMINLRNIPFLFRIKAFTPHFKYAGRFFKHPHLLMAYTFQNIYVGQSPFDSPALFSMVPAAELTEGSFFPSHGGIYMVVEKMLEKATELGVQFYYNNPVDKIILDEGRATGIKLGDGTHAEADIVVANADLPYVYRDLLPDKRKSAHFKKLKYACSAVCFHWGIDKVYPQLDHHNVFLSDGFREGLMSIFRDKLVSDKPSFYIHSPSATDKTAAPENQDSLSVIVAAGHIDRSKVQEWNIIKEKTRSYILMRLKEIGIHDLEDHIKFELCFSPESWENECNISKGAVFGSLAHNIFQMGYFRPHNRHDKYKNLYFVGGSTHPGNGIPNVLLSAKLVSERILKENQTNNKSY
jgi:phytoene desaturase